ncbi:toxin Tbo-IT2-like isoform X2 [Macrobrachium nipponense]|uniref:toxin Tbo-IT2-like isoform X2 n=1 Tax=Macrobrachium nipponense TaxID=159736 RepID=UPI0030C7D442
MGSKVLVMVLAFSLVLSIAMAQPLVEDEPFYILDHEEDAPPPEADYTTDLLERLLARTAQKRDDMAGPIKRWRSCIPRGGACTHRPQACCNSSSCRCNLWGTNCRCQRMGLFQQLGK